MNDCEICLFPFNQNEGSLFSHMIGSFNRDTGHFQVEQIFAETEFSIACLKCDVKPIYETFILLFFRS